MSSKNNRHQSQRKLRTKLILIYLIVFGFKISSATIDSSSGSSATTAQSVTFHFPEYAYKETSKNEITYREFEASCEHSTKCEESEGIDQIKCVRRCISKSCYSDIYAFDELEEGEIDVRLNSFKGCVIQRTTRNTHRM